MVEQRGRGPLSSTRILEFSSIGPGPHATMLLADLGAEVLRIERAGGNGWPNPILDRGRHTVEINIRSREGRDRVLALIDRADVLIEGYRPGVMERLGLGPDEALARNPRLIYGRMTGWGQTGPLSQTAGHDINYIAVTGALAAIVDGDGRPIPPLSLVGDFGGGSLYLALGVVSALFERTRSGRGQVIDAAIVDGVASLMAIFYGLATTGQMSLGSQDGILTGAAPFYRSYKCKDGRYVAVGPIEAKFYEELLDLIEAPADMREGQYDARDWRRRSEVMEAIFLERTQAQWCEVLEKTDACFAPVLTWDEAPDHPHMAARGIYRDIDGFMHPMPAPRLSRTPSKVGPGGNGEELERRWLATGTANGSTDSASVAI